MSPISERILRDHGNYRRLLDILERHVDDVAAGARPDYEMMGDIMHYMTHYPDMFHHPFEDRLFVHILGGDRSAQPLVDALLEEHDQITSMSKKLLEDLGAVVHEKLIPWLDMEAEARDYIARLREHMSREEQEMLPLAEQVIAEQPAAVALDAADLGDDPLFGGVVEQRYRELYGFIVREDDARRSR